MIRHPGQASACAFGLSAALLGAFLATACGDTNDETPRARLGLNVAATEPAADSREVESAMLGRALAGPSRLVCPPGSALDAGGRLCVAGGEAVGPFTWQMKVNCKQSGGGPACDSPRWALTFARSLRGTGVCPPGATQSSRGICIEGKLAFGPFTEAHVQACEKNGGGSPCRNTLDWDAAFAEATAPQLPANTNLPWKWIAGLDYGLRTDGCGAGNFRAARGGGTRIHKGIDVLLPVGANLYSPCNGTVETGYDSGGYGNYLTITCRVPDTVARGENIYVSMLFGHLQGLSVRSGQSVSAGQKIGTNGKSGNANSSCINPHVHFEAIVRSSAFQAMNALPRSMIESESRREDEGFPGTLATASGLAAKLQSNCMGPLGFRAPGGLTSGEVIDPFVLLTCLAGNKPALQRPGGLQSTYWPWNNFYAATGFNVNIGRR